VHDVLVTPRDVNPKETHEGGQRLAGYVGDSEVGITRRHSSESHGIAVHNSLAA